MVTKKQVSAVNKAAKAAAGVSAAGRVEAGLRTDRTGTVEYGYCADQRKWHDVDAPNSIGDLFDLVALSPSELEGGAVLDLYVYDREGELITNVCAVVAADGELLACFDSVTLTGMERQGWWLEGTECKCEGCVS